VHVPAISHRFVIPASEKWIFRLLFFALLGGFHSFDTFRALSLLLLQLYTQTTRRTILNL